MKNWINTKPLFLLIAILPLFTGCMHNNERATKFDSITNLNSGNSEYKSRLSKDQTSTELKDLNLSEPADTSKKPEAVGSKPSMIVVYYFHPTARCETCLNIEKYSKEAVNSWINKYDGKVIWKALNIDEKENEQYVDRYSLQFSSLILSEQAEGKELRWKNLEDIWKLAGNKSEFISYMNNQLNQFTN